MLWCSLALLPQLVSVAAAEQENRQIATTSNSVEQLHFVRRSLTVSADAASGPLTTASEINTEPAKKFFVFVKVEKP